MYYTIYKTTNNITGEYYIGQHQTTKLDDGYIGSGIRFKHSVNKYGAENFAKEILFIFDNFEDMNNKEMELVDQVYLDNPNTLNVIPGGSACDTKGFITAKLKGSDKYHLVTTEEFATGKYTTPTNGTLIVVTDDGSTKRITCEEYAKGGYNTPSTGYVSVYFKDTGQSGRVLTSEFNPILHKKVFGGIVATKDGKRQYVNKQELEDGTAVSPTKGKVTALVLATGKVQHIPIEEFKRNRYLYKHNTEGKVTGRHNVTNEKRTFYTSEVTDEVKQTYTFSTKGTQTVYDIITNSFINIPVGTFDSSRHMSPRSIKFKCLTQNGEELFEYFGTAKDFFKQYNVPRSFWDAARKGGTWSTNRKKGSQYNNCIFKLIDWKQSVKE